MREIPLNQSQPLITQIRRYLNQSRFTFLPEWVQIISGEFEGVFGWISVKVDGSGCMKHMWFH